jgi:hypothetical protein
MGDGDGVGDGDVLLIRLPAGGASVNTSHLKNFTSRSFPPGRLVIIMPKKFGENTKKAAGNAKVTITPPTYASLTLG